MGQKSIIFRIYFIHTKMNEVKRSTNLIKEKSTELDLKADVFSDFLPSIYSGSTLIFLIMKKRNKQRETFKHKITNFVRMRNTIININIKFS